MQVMEDYLRQYGLVLMLTAAAVLIPSSVLVISQLSTKIRARPFRPNPLKNAPYECGMEAERGRWERFNVRYYRFALLFLLFDVEVVFLFPWASQAGALGWSAFGAVLFFTAAMVAGWAYEWKRGGMEWDETLPGAMAPEATDADALERAAA